MYILYFPLNFEGADLMNDYRDIINKKLDGLMMKYECDDPMEALVMYYAIDYEKELIEEIKSQGKDVNIEFKKMEQEIRMFDIDCLADPEKAEAGNVFWSMLNQYYETRVKKENV